MDSELEVRDDTPGDSHDAHDSSLNAHAQENDAHDASLDDPFAEEKNLVSLYELHYWRYPEVYPTVTRINAEFGTDFTPDEFTQILTNPKVVARLRRRDVPASQREFKSRLTPRQLDWIQVIIDPTSRKTMAARCKEFGITWQKHNAWMRNPLFSTTLRQETDKLAADRRHEVKQGLINEASNGNITAAKTYLEWTGEFKQSIDINVTHEHKVLVYKIIDVLAAHIPQDTLELVAQELESVLEGGPVGVTPTHTNRGPVERPSSPSRALKVNSTPQNDNKVIDLI
jgi:hypothetical protein